MSVIEEKTTKALRLFALLAMFSACLALPVVAQTQATVAGVGTGCNGPDMLAPPTLQSSRPLLGQSLGVLATNLNKNNTAYLIFGAALTKPLALANGCQILIDPTFFVTVGPFTPDAAGTVLMTSAMPSDLTLDGVQVTAQLISVGPLDATQFEVTNGLLLTLGTF